MQQCDFCSTQPVVRRFQCRDFESHSEAVGILYTTPIGERTNLELQSIGFWAACEECARLVDAEDIEGLVDRALRLLRPKAILREKLRTHLLWTYSLFFHNRLPDPDPGVRTNEEAQA